MSAGRVFTALFSLALLAACSPPGTQAVIRAGVLHSVDALPYFVLKDRGFDRDAGIRLQETQYIGGAAVLDAMQKNQVDLGTSIGSVVVVSAADEGLIPSAFVPVASESISDLQHPALALFVSNGITSYRQLEGQYLAANSPNSLGGVMIEERMKEAGVSSYSLVDIDFANQGLAVAGGSVAGASLTEPYLTQSIKRGDGHILDWLTGNPPFLRMPYTLIVFRSGFLRDHPDAARKYLQAYLRAVQWTNAHTTEARSILGRTLDIDEEVAQEMSLPAWPADGRDDPELLRTLETNMKTLGLIRSIPAPASLFDETILDAALQKAR